MNIIVNIIPTIISAFADVVIPNMNEAKNPNSILVAFLNKLYTAVICVSISLFAKFIKYLSIIV